MRIKRTIVRSAASLILAALFVTPFSQSRAVDTTLTAMDKSASAASSITSLGDVPRFNFLGPASDGSNQGDLEMLRVAHTTAGSDWADPLSANVGERVAFIFYFHNGVLGTTAHNTTLRVDLPNFETNQIKAKSWLWSNETAPISDTVINGVIKGNSGATINLPSNGRIEYVPGSTKLFTYDTGKQVVKTLPDGIILNGVNIGDIQGCWQFSGAVTFLADLKGQASLTLNKEVAEPSGSNWQKDITVNPGAVVAYRLTLQNSGNITATNATVSDQLPSYMSYVPNSTKIWNLANPNGTTVANGGDVFGTGISIPDMAAGANGVTYVTYQTRVDPNIPAGWWALNNIARVFLAGVEQDMDQATVRVFSEKLGLAIEKVVVASDGGRREQIDAVLGDTVTYQITVANTGNVALNNVIVRDVPPVFASFVPGSVRIGGSTVANSDQLVSGTGFNIGTLPAGASKVITLQIKLEGCPPIGGFQLLNTAFTRADGIIEISDTATVVVNVVQPALPTSFN